MSLLGKPAPMHQGSRACTVLGTSTRQAGLAAIRLGTDPMPGQGGTAMVATTTTATAGVRSLIDTSWFNFINTLLITTASVVR